MPNKKTTTSEDYSKIRNDQSMLLNRNAYWSDDDRKRLILMYDEGVGLSKISVDLGRTELAVVQQLVSLGRMPPTTRRSRKRSKEDAKTICHHPNTTVCNCPLKADMEATLASLAQRREEDSYVGSI